MLLMRDVIVGFLTFNAESPFVGAAGAAGAACATGAPLVWALVGGERAKLASGWDAREEMVVVEGTGEAVGLEAVACAGGAVLVGAAAMTASLEFLGFVGIFEYGSVVQRRRCLAGYEPRMLLKHAQNGVHSSSARGGY
jgi:hypothetical protein